MHWLSFDLGCEHTTYKHNMLNCVISVQMFMNLLSHFNAGAINQPTVDYCISVHNGKPVLRALSQVCIHYYQEFIIVECTITD